MNTQEKKKDLLKIVNIAIFVTGIVLLLIKAVTPEYIDAQGYLHEAFFLLPLGFGCLMIAGLMLLCRIIVSFVQKRNA